jgi:hypothetical protein
MFAVQTDFVKNKNGKSEFLMPAYSADEAPGVGFEQLPVQVRTTQKPMLTLGQPGQA